MTSKKYREELSILKKELINSPVEKQERVRSKIHALRIYYDTWSACPEAMRKLS